MSRKKGINKFAEIQLIFKERNMSLRSKLTLKTLQIVCACRQKFINYLLSLWWNRFFKRKHFCPVVISDLSVAFRVKLLQWLLHESVYFKTGASKEKKKIVEHFSLHLPVKGSVKVVKMCTMNGATILMMVPRIWIFLTGALEVLGKLLKKNYRNRN